MSLWLPPSTITMEQSSDAATKTPNPKRIIDIQTVKAAYTMPHINTLRTGSFKLFKCPFPGFFKTILTL